MIGGALEVSGPWFQTDPKELSQESIKWYTWGFESTALFTAKVARKDGDTAFVVVNGQACNESRCRMVDAIRIDLKLGEATPEEPVDRSKLVPVAPAESSKAP